MDRFIDWLISALGTARHAADVWLDSGPSTRFDVLTVHLTERSMAPRADWVMQQQGAFLDPTSRENVRVYVLPADYAKYRSTTAMEHWALHLLTGAGVPVDAIVPGTPHLREDATRQFHTLVANEQAAVTPNWPKHAWGAPAVLARMAPPPEGTRWAVAQGLHPQGLAVAVGMVSNTVIGALLISSHPRPLHTAWSTLFLLPIVLWIASYVTGDKRRRPLRSIWGILLGASIGAAPAMLSVRQGSADLTRVLPLALLASALYVLASGYIYRWLSKRQGALLPAVATIIGLISSVLSIPKIASWSFAQGLGVPADAINVDPFALGATFGWRIWPHLLVIVAVIAAVGVTPHRQRDGAMLVAASLVCLMTLTAALLYLTPWSYGDLTAKGDIARTHGLIREVCVKDGDRNPWRGPYELVPSTRTDLVLVTPATKNTSLRIEYMSGSAQIEMAQTHHC